MSSRPEAAGNFKQHPLPKLLFYLYRKQFTGMMSVTVGEGENRVFFRDGMPLEAQTTDSVEPISRIMLEQGWIDDAVYNMSLGEAAQSGQRQGDILRSSGAVTDDQVDQAFKLQLVRKLQRLFRLLDAQFALYREDHEFGRVADEAARLRVHPRRIIYHGIRNNYDLDRVREEMGAALNGQVFRLDVRKAPNLDRYQFGVEDNALLDLLRTKFWDVAGLHAASARGEADAWMMVYTLLVTDMLELRPASDRPVTPSELAHASRPMATPVPFTPPGESRPPSSHGPIGIVTGQIPMMRPGSDPPRAPTGSDAQRSTTPPVGSTRSTTPPIGVGRSGSNPPRPGSNPPRPMTTPPVRSGSNPPRPMTTPPVRSGSNPPRPMTTPPVRSGSTPPRPIQMTTQELRVLTPDALALKGQIDEKLKFLDQHSHFDLLGLPRDASKEQIKTAYLQHAKIYHPDRLAAFQLQALRPDVERLFARLSEAQSILLDDRRRQEYVQTLDGAARGDADKARKILAAERCFQEGEMAMRHKNFGEAEAKFKEAVDLNPEEGEHFAMLAWSIYQNPTNSRGAVLEQVKSLLTKAIKLGRMNPRPYYLLGEVFLAENDLDKAIAYFRKSLELREDHVEAERGLRLAVMRKEKAGSQKGWFRRK